MDPSSNTSHFLLPFLPPLLSGQASSASPSPRSISMADAPANTPPPSTHFHPSAAADPPSAPPHHDWELLSMSMAASTFGTPDSASLLCKCDFCTGKTSIPDSSCLAASHPHPALPQSLTSPTSTDPNTNPSPVLDEQKLKELDKSIAGDASSLESDYPVKNWLHHSDNDHTAVVKHEGRQIPGGSTAEPFTDGWKPRRGNSPADLLLDLAPATLRAFPAFSDVSSADVKRAPYQEVNEQSNPCSIDKTVYTAEAGPGILEGTVEVENLAEGGKVNKKSDNSLKERSPGPWWTRHASLWKIQGRETNTLWSIALAASIVGVVILGYRWQLERSQNQQLRMQLSAQDEKIGDLRHQVTRLKDVITGRRRVSVTRGSY